MQHRLNRREVMALVGGAAAWPIAGHAQQLARPVVGVLGGGTAAGLAHSVAAFRRGLSEGGYIEGRNVAIEYRWAEDQNDLWRSLAADLVRHGVDVIVTFASAAAARAAKAKTATIPIVFYTAFDPVELGLVASLSRPGANTTGVTSLSVEVGPKRLELIQELLPKASRIGLLVDPTSSLFEAQSRELSAVAGALGLQSRILHAGSERDFERVFATLVEWRADALVVGNGGFFYNQRIPLAALAKRQGLPLIFPWRDAVADGGLMSYGGNIADAYRLIGVYAARILKGEKPANLPVHQATKLELVIN